MSAAVAKAAAVVYEAVSKNLGEDWVVEEEGAKKVDCPDSVQPGL